jgi:putative hydrolase of the HAD superfamily
MIKNIIFDWGDTVMRDYPELSGPMFEWAHVELIPYVFEALDQLKSKYTLVIATNAGVSDTVAMKKALARVGVEGLFSQFYSSKELGVCKPDPKFFLEVCKCASLQLNETVLVGNDYEKDIIGAKSAGLKTVFFNEKLKVGTFDKADVIIQSMNLLVEAINSLQ